MLLFPRNSHTKCQIPLSYLSFHAYLDPSCTPLLESLLLFFFLTWIFNSVFLPGLTCFVWNVTSLPFSLFFFLCPHIDCFMGVSGYRGATSQEAVCNEIINIAEKSVRYCSTVSHPLDFRHKVPPSDSKSSLIVSQQPQAQQRRVTPDRSQPSQDL